MMGLWKRGSSLLPVIFLGIFFGSESVMSESFNVTGFEETTAQDTETLFPEVKIPQGIVQGSNLVTSKNRKIFGFRGIPFGKPPLGNLRFKSPVPADAWIGTLDGTHESNMCPQIEGQTTVGDEDCLYLNVYTPRLPIGQQPKLLPVMMVVYGGGFKAGNNNISLWGPGYLLDKDIVLVVPNYRSGALGFLSTGDKESPGNYGLKDLVLALKWIRDNIKFFGGDPEQVTLMGHSTGSICVNHLALSDLTIGLFHRYITQSGAGIGFIAHQPRATAMKNALRLGENFGCSTSTSTVLISCLRDLNASQIVATVFDEQPLPWSPTDEPDIEGALLTDSPTNLLAAGKIRDLPSITGGVLNEGLQFSASKSYHVNPDEFEDFLANIDSRLPYDLVYYNEVDDVSAYTAAFKEFYFNNDLTSNRSVLISNFTDLSGDAAFTFPVYEQLQRQFTLAKSPTYFYSFEYQGTFSHTNSITGSLVSLGVTHADDLIYLFPQTGPKFTSFNRKMSKNDMEMVDIMVDLWTSFIIDGIPTSSALNANETWEPYSSRNNYLRIGSGSNVSLDVEYTFHEERMELWQKLISTHGSCWYDFICLNSRVVSRLNLAMASFSKDK